MDAFFASIEQAINPRLRGKPVIVGSRGNRLHTVVCAASYEAKACGIDSGMPTQEAFRLCPDACFVAADQGKYIWTSEQIFELLKGYGFAAVYASIDEFQMDIPETIDSQGLAEGIQKEIRERFNITASIGIARNCLLAKLASKLNKPNGLVVLTDSLETALAAVPVSQLCGVGLKTGLVFDGLGIRTCWELYQKSAGFLEQVFGKNGLNLYAALHSIERLDPAGSEEKIKSVGHSYTLPRASENTGFIRAWVRLLSEMVARRLRQQNMAARTIHLWLSGPEMGHFGAQKTYREPANDGYEIYLKALKIMAKASQKTPKIRALGVTCSGLFSGSYPPLFNEQKRREELTRAVDTINTRYGDWSVYPAIISQAKKSR